MKKVIIWMLVLGLLVGFLVPIINSTASDTTSQAATFGFEENLVVTYGQTATVPLGISENCTNLVLKIADSVVLKIKNPKKKYSIIYF